jgi:uncharacterized protein YheU (UPF0270 family)
VNILNNLKQHFEDFIAREGHAIGSAEHTAAKRFAEFLQGRQAVANAVELLTGRGNTVSGPDAPAPAQPTT